MSEFKAPIRDLEFVLFEVFNFHLHYNQIGSGLDQPMVMSLIHEYAKFCEKILAPLNAVGDLQGCSLERGQVITPEGFKEAYAQYCDAGWPSLGHPTEYGGQGLPESLAFVINELSGTANYAWNMYPGLSQGAMYTLETHGSSRQKDIFLPKLVSGQWTGTMCLTEPQCGSDLGLLRTKAEPLGKGRYAVTGNKIFISSGDHDLAENIVHIVLARLPNAPEGIKGISLFVVPKYLVDASGQLREKNKVSVGNLEHKMGIHGNATCALNFEGAEAELIGEPHKGLQSMFTFMNLSRLGTAQQGVSHAEWGYQQAKKYAAERLQMRSLTGIKNTNDPADPIIVHPDVRRMLLTQKALCEGMRMMVYFAAKRVDQSVQLDNPELMNRANDILSIVTPIAKGFMSELGFESANLSLQTFGGHGYITETGVEQNVRDCRIASLYEGTTGIQALDLLARKVLLTDGKLLESLTQCIRKFCNDCVDLPEMISYVNTLNRLLDDWFRITALIGKRSQSNADEVGAASVDYLMYSGYIFVGYMWARAARVSLRALAAQSEEVSFYTAKIQTARFYFDRILPRTESLKLAIESGSENLMAMQADSF